MPFVTGSSCRIHSSPPLLRMLVMIVTCATAVGAEDSIEPRLRLRDTVRQATGTPIRQGVFRVYENRAAASGRVLELDIVVFPAIELPAKPDPVFFVAGGPGQNATAFVDGWARHGLRQARDIVLLSQRGTSGGNRLQCGLPGSDDDIQGYFEPAFDADAFRECLKQLRQRADLRMVARYCDQYVRWQRAHDFVMEKGEGWPVMRDGKGVGVHKYPQTTVASQLSSDLHKFEDRLGLSPGARAGLAIENKGVLSHEPEHKAKYFRV